MTPFPKSLARTVAAGLLFSLIGAPLFARELKVDARGGAEYNTLAAASAAARPGDTILIAKGSGPYRETLYIKQSGTAEAPIVVEGNGETITALVPLVFQKEGDIWTARLPLPFPCVLMHKGERVLQDPAAPADTFLAPIRLREDKRTVELLPGASPEGWEASARDCPVRISNCSWQTFRNLVATGGTNDGFNLHGDGKGLRFENITGCNNMDEGFSSHDTMSCEIEGGEFWGNDNGLANAPICVMTARNLRIHDNLGWGLVFNGASFAYLFDVQVWGNGMAQIIFGPTSAGSCERVVAWAPTWPSRPWRSYTESSTSKAAALTFRGETEKLDPAKWQGSPQIATTPIPSIPKAATAANPSLAVSVK
ncbi:MAG TPA: right-handed parallel beta-helix repeat-containing protein [Rariglobus sp.]|nr:right-handed parallel beta-helix repeat-containing protein [Rariglobus sp.]